MQAHFGYTHQRLTQLADRFWQKVYATTRPVDAIEMSERCDRIPYAAAQKLAFKPAAVGVAFGPVWATYWFKVAATVPAEWAGKRVDLLWNTRSEATLWVDGRTRQGLNFEGGPFQGHTGVRTDAALLTKAEGGEKLAFQVEVACNRMFGGASSDSYRTVSPFVLDQCELALFDDLAWDIANDLQHLTDLAGEVGKDLDKAWGGLLLSELNRFANAVDEDDRSTWAGARQILKPLFERRNASVVHELTAVGHAHIDTAWLWPIAETWRKCMRTFSSQVAYMDAYPEYKFVGSQAVQYAKMKEMNPELYERIKAKVKTKQFVPVGGSWVEPDCNIPSGEALMRQFLYGQRFFKAELGAYCREFWNPDVFGYNGQLPQIMRLNGITRFLTQKLSWNCFNKPLHHTFDWEGIDGSKVLAHFPPADTYNAIATVPQLRDNARNYKDHDRSRHSMMLFGHGDGGGGPTKRMIEQLRRAVDLEGLPRTKMRTSDEFFTLLEQDCTDRVKVVGELYFELHRGTYTTQGATKRGNRLSEFMLHEVEFLAAVASRTANAAYPKDDLDKLWRLLLTDQFHDILPGSSIRLVYEDAERDYAYLLREAGELRGKALRAVIAHSGGNENTVLAPVNTTAFARKEVAAKPDGALAMVEVPSYGVGKVMKADDHVIAQKLADGKGWRLENVHLRADLSADGRLLSLVEKSTGRESLAAPGNILELYDDHPTQWDAWDVDPYHLETGKPCAPAESAGLKEETTAVGSAHHRDGNIRASVLFQRKIGTASSMLQTVTLAAGARRLEFRCETTWRERHKFLKVAFPLDVRAMTATYEMQFGCVERPTHFNTSQDLARYEVPGHKWADLSEPGFGVALLSDSKYGWSCLDGTLRMSLLRAPTSPDPEADQGKHVFAYAVMPHAGDWREGGVVAEAFAFNCPIIWARDGKDQHWRSYAGVTGSDGKACSLVLDTIKRAEDSNALVLRLYEAHGARGTAKVALGVPFSSARFANGLEEAGGAATVKDGAIEVPFKPFQVITLLVE